jgi:hypothetical protein
MVALGVRLALAYPRPSSTPFSQYIAHRSPEVPDVTGHGSCP